MSELYKKVTDKVFEISILQASDKELEQMLKERSLGLSLEEIKKIQGYFRKEKRNPTDVELEALSQAWSEHCCYKTSRPILERTVLDVKVECDPCIVSEDAAVVEFDDMPKARWSSTQKKARGSRALVASKWSASL